MPKLPYHDYRKRIEDYLKLHRIVMVLEIERRMAAIKIPEDLCLYRQEWLGNYIFLVTLISDSKSEADGSTLCSIDSEGSRETWSGEKEMGKENITIDEYNQLKEIIGKKPIEKTVLSL